MSVEATAALHRIAMHLDGIEHRSRMYASHFEALEAQVHSLVGLRQILWGYGDEDFDVNRALIQFTHTVMGQWLSTTLCYQLRDDGRLADLPRLLGDFARWVAREWPPR